MSKIRGHKGRKYPLVYINSDLEIKEYSITIKRSDYNTIISFPSEKCLKLALKTLTSTSEFDWKPNYNRLTLAIHVSLTEEEADSHLIIIRKSMKKTQ